MARKAKSKNASAKVETPPAVAEPAIAENSIEPKLTPAKPPPKRPRSKSGANVPATEPRADDPASRAATASRPIPDSIRERFIAVGSEFYFPDGSLALRDHGTKLTTPSDNTEVVRSLVEIAKLRGWQEITVSGTQRFNKEAWRAATLAGISVDGYTPSAFEREHIIRAMARRNNSAELRVANEPSADRAGRQSSGAPEHRQSSDPTSAPHHSGERQSPQSRDPASSPSRESDGATFSGRLVDHGAASYQHDTKQPMSYFVRLETPKGDREVWGVDLERAMRESLTRPTMGDQVTVKGVGRKPVTVLVERHDDDGRVIGTAELTTHRNRWVVEHSDFLARRAEVAKLFRNDSISPEEGTKRYPELMGTYLQLQIAKSGAEREIAEPSDRKRFVERARAELARRIEHGEPMDPVRMQGRAADGPESRPRRDRNMEPAR